MTTLKERIDSLERKNVHSRYFVPHRDLHEVLTRDAIHEALQDSTVPGWRLKETIENVMNGGRRIFAILVLMDEVDSICKFIGNDQLEPVQLDSKLPYEIPSLEKILSQATAKNFYKKQWKFSAPTFSRTILPRFLHNDTILPFLKDQYVGAGSFGTVFEIEVDPAHQRFDNISQQGLVRKEFSQDTDHHEIELENLSILSHLRHPNIIPLLVCYTYKNIQNLVFPLADGGDLSGFLSKDRQQHAWFQNNETFLMALAGLSSGLENLHEFCENTMNLKLIGCHHDLRPKNILVSKDMFIIADFGLSRFKDASDTSRTRFKKGKDDYLAPECEDLDNDFEHGIIRRSSDIWSFGCIIAEVITYMNFGAKGVSDFRDQRKFQISGFKLSSFHCGLGKPNIGVLNWVTQMERESSRASNMVLRLVRRMLSLREQERPRVKQVTARLRLIAVYEATEEIDKLFLDILNRDEWIEAFLEQKRFDSWKYAIGMIDDAGDLDMSEKIVWSDGLDFEVVLQHLSAIRAALKEFKSQNQGLKRQLLVSLHRLNNCLIDLLDWIQQEESRTFFALSMIEGDDEELCQRTRDKFHDVSGDKKITMLANIKRMTNLAKEHWEEESRWHKFSQQLSVETVKTEKVFGNHHLGKLKDGSTEHPVLIEWRRYGLDCVKREVSQELFVRVDALAELMSLEKPDEFRVLHCRGFYHDQRQSAFGLVYDLPNSPESAEDTLEPTTLQRILLDSHRRNTEPFLEDKFALARILANLVLEFHTVGWLHKALSSSNIALFPSRKLPPHKWATEPYIIGFNHSRPDEPSAFTVGVPGSSQVSGDYLHPDYLRGDRRYCAAFDYYSLGIVLLEIGLWQSLESMTKSNDWKLLAPEKFRDRLIERRVEFLGRRMGTAYCEVVRVCLLGKFGQADSEERDEIQERSTHLHFKRVVISPLNRLCNSI